MSVFNQNITGAVCDTFIGEKSEFYQKYVGIFSRCEGFTCKYDGSKVSVVHKMDGITFNIRLHQEDDLFRSCLPGVNSVYIPQYYINLIQGDLDGKNMDVCCKIFSYEGLELSNIRIQTMPDPSENLVSDRVCLDCTSLQNVDIKTSSVVFHSRYTFSAPSFAYFLPENKGNVSINPNCLVIIPVCNPILFMRQLAQGLDLDSFGLKYLRTDAIHRDFGISAFDEDLQTHILPICKGWDMRGLFKLPDYLLGKNMYRFTYQDAEGESRVVSIVKVDRSFKEYISSNQQYQLVEPNNFSGQLNYLSNDHYCVMI